MNRHFKQFSISSLATASGFLLAVVVMVSAPLLASIANFAVPDDTALRIRLDDTLTSVDSKVGDPFSALPECTSVRSRLRNRYVRQDQRSYQHGASV